MKRTSETEVEVRYAETDQMGIVHHSEYLVWFELARTRLCEESGHSYAGIEESGHWLVVTGAQARYREGARYGQVVTVTASLDWLGTRALRFAYEVLHAGRRLATGSTEHVWVDRTTRRHCRIPEPLREPFLRLADQESLRGGRARPRNTP